VARNPNRLRIDWTPCPAARDALEEARASMPRGISQQEVIDRIVIMGLFAMRTEALRASIALPIFRSEHRSYWRADRRMTRSGNNQPKDRANPEPTDASAGTTGDPVDSPLR
jgi:hypothetical protein